MSTSLALQEDNFIYTPKQVWIIHDQEFSWKVINILYKDTSTNFMDFFTKVWLKTKEVDEKIINIIKTSSIEEIEKALDKYNDYLNSFFENNTIWLVYKKLKIAQLYISAWKKEDFREEVLNVYEYIKTLANMRIYYKSCRDNTKSFIEKFF